MPDLENRNKHERELAALLLILLQEQRRRVEQFGEAASWNEFERGLRDRLAAQLAAVYLVAAERLAQENGIAIDAARLQADAEAWAAQYAAVLAAEIAGNSRDRVAEILRTADATAAVAALLLIFSDTRAAGIAATEITRANSIGERVAADLYRRETGKTLVAVWNTERDANVCPVCAPLDREPEELWRDKFASGPPGHPNCRCWLEYHEATYLKAA